MWYYVQSSHDNDENGSSNDSDQNEWSFYLQKRFEHRMSYSSFPMPSKSEQFQDQNANDNGYHIDAEEQQQCEDDEPHDDTNGSSPLSTVSHLSNDFFPKNTNWNHFEACSETKANKKTASKKRGECATGNITREQNMLSNEQSIDGRSPNRYEREAGSMWMSLEGDRAASVRNIVSVASASSAHQRLSDDEETTDGEDSQASRDHFVWTDSEYRASFNLKKQQMATARDQSEGLALPVILSERNVTLDQSLPTSGLTTPAFSMPSSVEGSISGDDKQQLDIDSNMAVPEKTLLGADKPGSHSTASSPPLALSTGTSTDTDRVANTRQHDHTLQDGSTGPTLPKIVPKAMTGSVSTKPSSLIPANGQKLPSRASSEPHSSSMKTSVGNRLFQRAQSGPSARTRVPVSEHRANYNARIMPHKLILIRHGQSMGNIDETMYSTTPDNAIPLTKLGWQQARAAGQRLKQVLNGSGDVHFIVSPYVRTVETFHGIVSAWSDPEKDFNHLQDPLERRKAWYGELVKQGLSWSEDPRIREQDFGNLQDPVKIKAAKKERNQFGAFYYRFAHGESGADVFDRISTFLDSLWRSFDAHPSRNFVLVTHGISIRVLLARYFRYTIDQFHLLSNPRNCEMVVLTHDGHGRLQMAGRHELEMTQATGPTVNGDGLAMRYKYRKRLRVLPPDHIRRVRIRICSSEYEAEDDDE